MKLYICRYCQKKYGCTRVQQPFTTCWRCPRGKDCEFSVREATEVVEGVCNYCARTILHRDSSGSFR